MSLVVSAVPLAFAVALAFGSASAACSGGDDTAEPPPFDPGDGRSPSEPNVPDAGAPGDAASDSSAPPDPCATKAAVCPTQTTTAGAGLTAIDRCAFPMKEATTFTTLPPLVTALEKIATPATTATILADLNRTATAVAAGAVPGTPPGVDVAVRWDTEDEDSEAWIPQGITGSADASSTGLVDGRRVVLVSWYYTPPAGSTYEKGARIAFVDITNPLAPTYRFALLVEPKGTAAAPDFVPVTLHAGGIVWLGNLLYVAETGRGFRVFDLSRAMRVATDVDEIGCASGTCRAGLYKYVLPQIGAYASTSACSPLFSWVSLDRSTTPPSLLSGEYCSGTACAGPLAARAFRWPLDAATGRLPAGTSWPSEAVLLGQAQIQGAASRNGTWYLSSSEPAAGAGALVRARLGKKSATSKWLDAPEDLMVDEANGLLWSLSELAGARVVAGMKLTSYPPP
jgi:hypothetical protein